MRKPNQLAESGAQTQEDKARRIRDLSDRDQIEFYWPWRRCVENEKIDPEEESKNFPRGITSRRFV